MTTAWKLQLRKGLNCAIGEMSLIHLVSDVKLLDIAAAPDYCNKIFVWNDVVIPLIDLGLWVTGKKKENCSSYIGIIAYHCEGQSIRYIGMNFEKIPEKIEVSDEQLSKLATNLEKWKEVSLSCFCDSNEDIIPILDVQKISKSIIKLNLE